MFRYHTWEWAIDHCPARQVSDLKARGFGTSSILDKHYHGFDKNTGVMAQCKRRIIAFHRGSGIRVTEYSKAIAKELKLV